MVTLDVTVYSGCLGTNNVPPSLAGEAMMVTLDHTGCSVIDGESTLLFDGAWRGW
jgi:hypothetical protein